VGVPGGRRRARLDDLHERVRRLLDPLLADAEVVVVDIDPGTPRSVVTVWALDAVHLVVGRISHGAAELELTARVVRRDAIAGVSRTQTDALVSIVGDYAPIDVAVPDDVAQALGAGGRT
jgi:hypothetical protein